MSDSFSSHTEARLSSSILDRVGFDQTVEVDWLRVGHWPMFVAPVAIILAAAFLGFSVGLASPTAVMFILAAVPALYLVLAFVLNHARIRRTASHVEISHRPMPLAPRRKIEISANPVITVVGDLYTGGHHSLVGRTRGEYGVEVEDASGRRRRIISDLTRAEAERVVAHLERPPGSNA